MAAGGGALCALLAGRPREKKRKLSNKQKLQEAVLCLLNRHLNLDDLLLEVGRSDWSKPLYSINSGRCSSEASDPEQFSALQNQASALGLPVGVLSAKVAARNVGKFAAGSGQTAVLNAEQRKELSCLLQALKALLAHNVFCQLVFAQELWKEQGSLAPSPLGLEVAWHLQRENILGLQELLENHPDASALENWLCGSLRLLCAQAENASSEPEPLGCTLADVLTVLLQNGFGKTFETGTGLESPQISKVCRAVLESMLAWVLDAVAEEKQGGNSTGDAAKSWIAAFDTVAHRGPVPPEPLQQFFSHTLTQILTYKPEMKVSDAIRLQREWSFARTSQVLTMLFCKVGLLFEICKGTHIVCSVQPGSLQLFVSFRAEQLIHHLLHVLETSEVNWHHILSCVSTFLVCHAEAEGLIKDLLLRLLRKAFENYDLESMITAFLIVRQAALNGPVVFMPYSDWFKVTFGSASSFQGSSKKALIFLFKFLSELVPFESPQYLKVHILYPPFVPTKYRPFLLEYVTLAKTRLADFKVSIENMGLYEDVSALEDAVQPRCQALQDVEKATQIFENTGKIPASVMEASIFRRSYYIFRFLPALLVPRVLPQPPDSRMALIDALKRSEKIPPSAYAAYTKECQALQEKLLQGESTAMEPSESKDTLEPLKAALQALRLLIADQHRHSEVPAQVAQVSAKLSGVLGPTTDEQEAASLDLKIQINLLDPAVGQRDLRVINLLLTSFCQNIMAASYFLPPNRQGSWPSLFVKMICGHHQLWPPLLHRLCQLLLHQGCDLNDDHVIGLSAFVVHLNEAKSLIPKIEICLQFPSSGPEKVLSVSELWDHLFTCQTGESAAFCMRFCAAALSYSLCKFSSLPFDGLCSLVHPGFVKKLQYVLPRLKSEARQTGGPAELAWKALSSGPPVSSSWEAACRLWRQASFRELLQQKPFQLTLQEWLLMELGVHPDKDFLSPCERQEFHYWALYQHYLPMPVDAGGSDGDLQKLCAVLVGAILDFRQRSEVQPSSKLKDPKCFVSQGRGNPDLYCRLQELVLELELRHRRAPRGVCSSEERVLFGVFCQRLRGLGSTLAMGGRLLRQQELLLQTRILLSLPPSILIATRQNGRKVTLNCDNFFSFVNEGLRNICEGGCSLAYDITAHFFRGLLSISLECDEPAEEVTAVLASCQTRCPIILCSAARWWQRLKPVIVLEWERLFSSALAPGLQSLQELQSSVDSLLSSQGRPLASDLPWVSIAFLHFTIQQQVAHEKMMEVLEKLEPDLEQLLGFLLFFSVVDFISARIAPQDGLDAHKALDWSSRLFQCLKEPVSCLLSIFRSPVKGHKSYQILHCAVSDQHLRLFPVAFYSLLFTSEPGCFFKEPAFLYTALDMYIQLLQLFVEGVTVVGTSQNEESPHASEPGSSVLIRKARQILLHAIPHCPQQSFSNLHQLLDLCEELDPEVKSALVHSSADGGLLDEELLHF